MFVTRTIQYEIENSIGEDAIRDALENYTLGTSDDGDTISYYDLDAKNEIIFLKVFQEQLDTYIAERINYLKKNCLEKEEAAATN